LETSPNSSTNSASENPARSVLARRSAAERSALTSKPHDQTKELDQIRLDQTFAHSNNASHGGFVYQPGPFTNNRTIPQPYRTHVRLSRGFFATQAADRKETNGDGSHRAGDPDGVAGCAALARLRIIEPKTMLWSGLIAHQYPWPANPRGTKTARW
jgi:hypothetical protein